jgi:sodium/bile acid cotransporter 7
MLARIKPDGFTIALLTTVLIASFLPCRGDAAVAFGWATKIAITLLFFMHGAKLSREAILGGIGAWRLHLAVTFATFVLFPLLGILIGTLPDGLVDTDMKAGMLFLAILPSTVQSSIAFTSIAGGNVAGAVCSASLSNILGVILTPLLAGVLIHSSGGSAGGPDILSAIISVATTLLLPFILGHLSRPITAKFVNRHKALLGRVDRGSILLVVYTAFSAAVIEGLWSRITAHDLIAIALLSILLLSLVLCATKLMARLLGFSRPDEITLVFCGSKKSLASGVPIAAALFPAAQVGPVILPLMLFHQIQLIACAFIARAYAESAAKADAALAADAR